MCGIFGIIAKANATDEELTKKIISELFVLSESRGKESSGIAIRNYALNKIFVTKDDVPATELIRSNDYKNFLNKAFDQLFTNGKNTQPLSVLAHSRLVTNGTQENNNNNQPVIKDGVVMIHNGICTNVNDLWTKYNGKLTRETDVDTEFLASLYRLEYSTQQSASVAIKNVFNSFEGAASVGIFNHEDNQIAFATNTGSFYYCWNKSNDIFVFASEEFILKSLLQLNHLSQYFDATKITWLKPFNGLLIDPFSAKTESFSLKESSSLQKAPAPAAEILNLSSNKKIKNSFEINSAKADLNLLEFNEAAIRQIKRCTKCILPETFPFINFDSAGECNYCKNYKVTGQTKDKSAELEEFLKKYRKNNGMPDCIVAFSGGRDSSYGLHLLKEKYGLTPITYTYDWGMVTDLARRNIARITGKLGIENILVSADIRKKRKNIHKNVGAWLKNPKLGMIPLFMAGDKHFIRYVNIIKQQTGIELDVWMENMLENTNFKTGFAGIKPDFEKEKVDKQTLSSKLKMPLYYAKNFIINPRYINSSLPDTYSAFKSYYLENRGIHLGLFDYEPWDEETINRTLIDNYNWETSPDSTSTWRIGDGTAAFYNYIYNTVAGFTEFDTFRSNQIREGMITREFALEKIYEENRPRIDSLVWYLNIINIDFNDAIKRVNKIPKLYPVK